MGARILVFTVGKHLDDGRVEVLTSSFQSAVITPTTKRDPAIGPLQIGGRFRGTLKEVSGEHTVAELRPMAPDAKDAASLDAFRGKVGKAGISTETWGDSLSLLQASWNPAIALEPVDVLKVGLERLQAEHSRFPLTYWHDDPEPGFEEMKELLATLKVPNDLPSEMLVRAGKAIEESWVGPGTDGEAKARLSFCKELANAGNQKLARARDDRRFAEFRSLSWEDELEPLWLLLTPPQADGLVRERILRQRTS